MTSKSDVQNFILSIFGFSIFRFFEAPKTDSTYSLTTVLFGSDPLWTLIQLGSGTRIQDPDPGPDPGPGFRLGPDLRPGFRLGSEIQIPGLDSKS